MIPKKILILGHEYEILRQSEEEGAQSALGTHWGKVLRIWVSKDQVLPKAESTLLHEVLEAINYHLKMDLDHDNVCRLEAGLYQVLKENKPWIGGGK